MLLYPVHTATDGVLQVDMVNKSNDQSIRHWDVHRIDASGDQTFRDIVVSEEPLEIRIAYGPLDRRNELPLSVTMRTPGDDIALATGFFMTEGIVHAYSEIGSVTQPSENVVIVHLQPDVAFSPESQQRHFYTTSSCGVCGKASIDMVRQVSPYRLVRGKPKITSKDLLEMGEMLREAQPLFAATGGIHATALFNDQGTLLCIKEDIGRHNAMDKMIGWAAAQSLLPLSQHVVVVSGRGGFELVQKALTAGVALFVAVGAPSSLALELAEESDMTVVGFLREERMNVYTCPERVIGSR